MAITTLIPGEGWFAIRQYKELIDGRHEIVSRVYPVICFALIDGKICPMVSHVVDGVPEIANAAMFTNYEGLYHTSESAYVRADKTVVIVNRLLGEQSQTEPQDG